MTAEELLEELARRDVRIRTEGDALEVRAPRGALTPALRDALACHKLELLSLLARSGGATPDELPLAFGQRTHWFCHQVAPASAAYNLLQAARVRAAVDPGALRLAFQALLDRHEPLRTTYPARDGRPVQRVFGHQAVDFEAVEASSWDEPLLQRRVAEVADLPFDLERGPVLRAHLFSRAPREHVLVLTVHHIAADFWSLDALANELAVLYEHALGNGSSPAPLPPPGPRYRDFVRWQADLLSGPEGKRLESYWMQRLGGELPVLDLPTDRPRPPVQTFRGALKRFPLGAALTERLRARAQAESVTPFVLLLTAFKVLLHRYSGQDELLIGTPVSGRSQAEHEAVFGNLVNLVVLRSDLAGDPTFRALLGQVRQTVWEALAHQDYPFPLLVEQLQPPRDPGRSPLVQVAFIWDQPRWLEERAGVLVGRGAGERGPDPGRLNLEFFALEQRGAPFDLTLTVFDFGGPLSGALQYNVDLFDLETIDRMAGHFLTLLGAVAEAPKARISDLPLMSAAERQALAPWDAPAEIDRIGECFHNRFEAQVNRTPDAIAVGFEGRTLTYEALNRRANRVAHHLRSLGVGPDVRVGLCVERGLDMVVGLLGVLKAGGAYVPLDPAYPRARIGFMLEDAQVRMIVTQECLRDRLPGESATVVCLHRDLDGMPASFEENPEGGASRDDLAYVIYTSGSTGTPKGVMVSHRSLASFLLSMGRQPGLAASDTLLAVTTLSFDIAALELFLPLAVGARVEIASRELAMDGARLGDSLESTGATVMQATPSTWRMLIEAGWAGRENLTILCGGEALPRDLADGLLERGRAVWNLYGPTETTIWSALSHVEPDQGPVPIGRPIAATRLYVLDRSLQPVPVGVTGELYIGGIGVARGYLNRPALTAERFLPDPFAPAAEPGARMYRTGDLARYRASGEVECLGRVDQQVKIRGHRIELGEVEAALRSHPSVRAAVAIAHRNGDVEPSLVAYIVPRAGESLAVADLRAWLKERLPDYMVPSTFCSLDEIPLTPNGKLDTRSLPEPEECRIPIPVAASGAEAPPTPAESELARLAVELLRLERIGVNDNLFELGLDSLMAIRFVSQARKAGLNLVPAQVFRRPTIAGLAQVAANQPADLPARSEETGAGLACTSAPSILDAAALALLTKPGRMVEDAYAPSPMQEGMLISAENWPGSGVYIQQLTFNARGPIDVPAFERAWQGLLDHHAALRTAFDRPDSGAPIQVVCRGVQHPFKSHDWRGLPRAEQSDRFDAFLRTDRERGFVLSEPPLSRLALFQTAKDAFHVVWTHHHIILDGWSLEPLLRELLALYEGERSSCPVELSRRARFGDFVAWVRTRDLDAAERYWRELLRGFRAPTPLGIDRFEAGPGSAAGAGADDRDEQELALSEAATKALGSLARRHGLTLGTIVQGAWALLLGRYSGQDDVVFGVTVSGRSAPIEGIEGMIGLLINSLPVRVAIDGSQPVGRWLATLQDHSAELRQHDATPLALIQGWSEVGPGRPLFESLVVVENYPADATLRARAGALGVESVRVLEQSEIPLTLLAFPGRELVLRASYQTRRFEATTIDRMLGHVGQLLEGIAADAEQPIAALSILTREEARTILDQWNDAGRELSDLDVDRLSDEDVDALLDKILAGENRADE
jgi:amino acid adenylation domain-containing protein